MPNAVQTEVEARPVRPTTLSRLLHGLLGINEPEPDPTKRPKRPPQLIYSVDELPPIGNAKFAPSIDVADHSSGF
jgi:hypothetical protein